jgi:hypothetical protein
MIEVARITPGTYAFRRDITHVCRQREEFEQWLSAHGIPSNRISFVYTTIVVGGGRVSIDFVLPNTRERGRLTVPLCPEIELPSVFKP